MQHLRGQNLCARKEDVDAVLRRHPITGKEWIGSVNSCLVSVFSCHGHEIFTVEGVGERTTGYHVVQSRLARMNGTQCGYCSPGMVMSMLGLLEGQKEIVTMSDVEKELAGNICRCTGYRPILDAFKSLANDADPSLTAACPDIEDLPKKCIFAGELYEKSENNFVHFQLNNCREWLRVSNLKDLLKILEKINHRPYMLVGGNTGHGVYRRREDLEIFIDVNNVKEMKVTILGNVLEVGAAVTLSEFIDFLRHASDVKKEFSYCRQLVKHLELVAHPAVRNIGTIGGNLILKHQHPEFISDVFLLFQTIGAFLTIVDNNGIQHVATIEEFMYKSMRSKVLVKVTLPPLNPEKYSLVTYKIMPRAQNSHAIINAGFLFRFSSERKVLLQARICFGGISSRFVRAINTEKVLAFKNLFNDETISLTMASLNDELKLDWMLPDASPKYRKLLAMSLLYKAIISLAPSDSTKDCLRSGGEEIYRPLSSGIQKVTAPENSLPKIDGLIQCSGEAKYINDLLCMPNEVWGAFVPATEVSAKILSIDPSEALQIPGVVAFFCAKDIPGVNSYMTEVLIEPLEPPVATDIPVDFRVTFMKKQNLPAGLLGAKGVGEPAICMSIVAIFALRNAIESSRDDAGLGNCFVMMNAPTTKEDILLLSGTQPCQFTL
uniref:Uncharacterized protein n=1 Tax=Phlebotomus papatasi TaxID=29031 RepID=A0A1B0CZV7_PHLPP